MEHEEWFVILATFFILLTFANSSVFEQPKNIFDLHPALKANDVFMNFYNTYSPDRTSEETKGIYTYMTFWNSMLEKCQIIIVENQDKKIVQIEKSSECPEA